MLETIYPSVTSHQKSKKKFDTESTTNPNQIVFDLVNPNTHEHVSNQGHKFDTAYWASKTQQIYVVLLNTQRGKIPIAFNARIENDWGLITFLRRRVRKNTVLQSNAKRVHYKRSGTRTTLKREFQKLTFALPMAPVEDAEHTAFRCFVVAGAASVRDRQPSWGRRVRVTCGRGHAAFPPHGWCRRIAGADEVVRYRAGGLHRHRGRRRTNGSGSGTVVLCRGRSGGWTGRADGNYG